MYKLYCLYLFMGFFALSNMFVTKAYNEASTLAKQADNAEISELRLEVEMLMDKIG